jgi:hypothetical protein
MMIYRGYSDYICMGQRCSRTHNSKVCSLVHMLEISTCGEKRKNMDEDALIQPPY